MGDANPILKRHIEGSTKKQTSPLPKNPSIHLLSKIGLALHRPDVHPSVHNIYQYHKPERKDLSNDKTQFASCFPKNRPVFSFWLRLCLFNLSIPPLLMYSRF
jgi:hypothetical protein